jgi:hypothetical protein
MLIAGAKLPKKLLNPKNPLRVKPVRMLGEDFRLPDMDDAI